MTVGICGVFRFDSKSVDLARFEKMTKWFRESVSSARLIRTWYAVAQAGYESTGHEGECLVSKDSVTVCFEGIIDNRRQIIRQLGLEYTCSYADIVLRAYQVWGTGLARQILGAFRFILIDEKSQLAVIATDHLSLKPVFYYQDAHKFVFGSDIRQVLDGAGIRPIISSSKILEFLSPLEVIDEAITNPETTFFEEIKSLPYATCLVISNNGIKRIKYWEPPKSLSREQHPQKDFFVAFRELFFTVVSDYLDTIHPIGIELSGGIDSGSLVFVAHEILRREGRLSESLHTYTLAYNFPASVLDVNRMKDLLRRYPTIQWHRIEASNLCGPLECGPFRQNRSIAHPCLMNIPESYVAVTKMAQANGCKILLTGNGADSYLEGSDVIWDSVIRGRKWKIIWNAINVLRTRGSFSLLAHYLYRYAVLPLMPFGVSNWAYLKEYYRYTVEGFYPDLFTAEFSHEMNNLLTLQTDMLSQKDALECWAQRLEHDLLFPPVHVEQGISVNIEVRHPYLDRRLIEFGLTVPPEFKFEYSHDKRTHYGSRKILQRKGLRGIVPSEILDWQFKATYSIPLIHRLRLYLPRIFSKSRPWLVVECGIIDMCKLEDWLNKLICDPRPDYIEKFYPVLSWLDRILNLELWLEATVQDLTGVQLPKWGNR